jgi:uncharacterized metal-binding protein
MRNLKAAPLVIAALCFAAISLSSCGNSNNSVATQAKEKEIEQNMRTDSVHQDHTAVADSAQHGGGMSVGGK